MDKNFVAAYIGRRGKFNDSILNRLSHQLFVLTCFFKQLLFPAENCNCNMPLSFTDKDHKKA